MAASLEEKHNKMEKEMQKGAIVGPQFCSAKEEVLHLWQACSVDAHVTHAQDGQLLFNLRNPPCYNFLDRQLVLRDASTHAPLLCTKRKCFNMRKETSVFQGDSTSSEGASSVFTVRLARMFQLSCDLDVFLDTPSTTSSSSIREEHGVPDYKVKASCFTNCLTIIKNDGTIVAKAKRNFSFWCCACFKPDYNITVYPGVDQAFVALLVAMQDNFKRNFHGNAGFS